eukprot:2376296-Prymnesium_polylepis.1
MDALGPRVRFWWVLVRAGHATRLGKAAKVSRQTLRARRPPPPPPPAPGPTRKAAKAASYRRDTAHPNA